MNDENQVQGTETESDAKVPATETSAENPTPKGNSPLNSEDDVADIDSSTDADGDGIEDDESEDDGLEVEGDDSEEESDDEEESADE